MLKSLETTDRTLSVEMQRWSYPSGTNTNPAALVLSGPYRRCGYWIRRISAKILRELAEQGVGIIVISDDVSELIRTATNSDHEEWKDRQQHQFTQELDETSFRGLLTN